MTSRARRRLGQHFLADPSAVRRIVATLDPRPGEPVLEIGPGRGALTGALIEAAGHVAAVELDRRLVSELERRFPATSLHLVAGDILHVPLAAVRAQLGRSPAARLAVVGNLPYEVSKPVALKLVVERACVDRAVLMFQREVAERLTAAPGSRAYGPLTVVAGIAYEIRRVFDLAPGAFRPPPQVTSTVTCWRSRGADAVQDDELERLRRCLRLSFAQRRRTLRNNLRAGLGADEPARAALERAGIDGGRRPEAVAPEEYRRLAAVLDPR